MAKKKGTRRKVILKRRAPGFELAVYYARRFGKYILIFILVVWLSAWFVAAGGIEKSQQWSSQKILDMSASAGFRVEKILVEGRENTDAALLKSLIGLEKGDPILNFDPKKMREDIEKISWVKSVILERRLPDTVYIEITERHPLAIWKKRNERVLIDEDGEILSDEDIQDFMPLITLFGEDAPEHAKELIEMIAAEPELDARMESAERISGRRWNLRLKNGIMILLPENDIGLALRRMMTAHEEDALLNKDIVNIDLRNSEKIIVKPYRGEAATWKSEKNEAGEGI